MDPLIIGAFIVLFIVIIIAVAASGGITSEVQIKAAGRRGEWAATERIKRVLRKGDTLLTNVSISFEGRPAELDNVIVNEFGIFIIEVKYYSGRLSGSEDDYEWRKVHISDAGNPYFKQVKNPIKQVKREVYILAKYLDQNGLSVWVEGYAMIIGASSPVRSSYILSSACAIDKAIHTKGKRMLRPDTVDKVIDLLS